jgi:hypothetical protein
MMNRITSQFFMHKNVTGQCQRCPMEGTHYDAAPQVVPKSDDWFVCLNWCPYGQIIWNIMVGNSSVHMYEYL